MRYFSTLSTTAALFFLFACSTYAYHTDCEDDLPTTDYLQNPDQPPSLFYVPHQDDDAVGASLVIGDHLDQGKDVFAFLYLPHTLGVNISLINGEIFCDLHKCFHHPGITITENVLQNSRNLEFLASMDAMGVSDDNIWICNENHNITQSRIVKDLSNMIETLEDTFPGAYHMGPAGWYDGACWDSACSPNVTEQYRSQPHCGNPHHAAFLDAVSVLFKTNPDLNVLMYRIYNNFNKGWIADWNHAQIKYEPENVDDIMERKDEALDAYKYWSPEEGRIAYGFHSVNTLITAAYSNRNILLDYHPDDPKNGGTIPANSCTLK